MITLKSEGERRSASCLTAGAHVMCPASPVRGSGGSHGDAAGGAGLDTTVSAQSRLVLLSDGYFGRVA